MLVAQGRFWNASLQRKARTVRIQLESERLPEDLAELRDFRVEIALERWQRLVRTVYSDRKLLGGVLLEAAHPEELLSRVIATDRLAIELQRIVVDATIALVEAEALEIAPASAEEGT